MDRASCTTQAPTEQFLAFPADYIGIRTSDEWEAATERMR